MDRIDLKSVFDTSHISKDVQNHLVRVYGMLGLALAACAAGVATALAFGLNLGVLPAFISMPLIIWVASLHQSEMQKKIYGLLAFGFLDGLTIGPLVDVVLHIDPSIPLTAFVATAIIFACFSAAAILTAGNRTYLFLGGLLSSMLSTMLWISIASWFFTSIRSMNYSLQLYGGLVMFMGYILYDTQVMIVKANAGERDFVVHALGLFVDFVAIFVRIMVILANSSNDKKKKQRGGATRSR